MAHYYTLYFPDYVLIAGSRRSFHSSSFRAPNIAVLRECLPVKKGDLIRGSRVEEISIGVERKFRAGLGHDLTVDFTGISEGREKVDGREVLVIRITKEAGEHELYHYARIIGGICSGLEIVI